MYGLSLEPTNICNRNCVHCIRNKEEVLESLSLEMVENILSQAKSLGIKKICLTGGEVTTYPHLEGLVRLMVDLGFNFNLVTNGFHFKERLLPLLSEPRVKEKLEEICFSLDGSRAETHDAIRGNGSFKEVIEAATLCKLQEVRISLKSVITNFNKDKAELTDLALLGATLGATDHGFLPLYPTPRLIKEKVIPSPEELKGISQWITASLARCIRTNIKLEGCDEDRVIFNCGNIMDVINIDYQGNLILCCNLSHVNEGEGVPTRWGEEFLADLREISLKDAIIRHYHAVARLMAARLNDMDKLSGLTYSPCYWCFKHFHKLEWLRDFPDSPWAAGVLGDH